MTREEAEELAARENAKGRPGVRYEVRESPATLFPPAFGGFYVRLVRGRG